MKALEKWLRENQDRYGDDLMWETLICVVAALGTVLLAFAVSGE